MKELRTTPRRHKYPKQALNTAILFVLTATGSLLMPAYVLANNWPGGNHPIANPPYSVGTEIAWWTWFWMFIALLIVVLVVVVVASIAGGFKGARSQSEENASAPHQAPLHHHG